MTSAPPDSSRALVQTARPARYGKQLVSHLGRRAESEWDDATGRGSVLFPFGRAELTAEDAALVLWVEARDDAALPDPVGETDVHGTAALDRLEDVVGRHLVRFGTRDELVVQWTRSDGSTGSEQRNTVDGPPA